MLESRSNYDERAESLIIAGLITRYFGPNFTLDRVRNVLALVIAVFAGVAVSSIGTTVASAFFLSPSPRLFSIWWVWFAADILGEVTVAPLVIGLPGLVRRPPPRKELIEGVVALVALAATATMIVWLPQKIWKTMLPGVLLLPLLMWTAYRCRPVFAAAGVSVVSLIFATVAIFGIGHFGDRSLPVDDRIAQAKAVVLFVALYALILSALFAERREREARLADSNMGLQRERDNKLMSLGAVAAAISHEVKQPLMAIAMNGQAGRLHLGKSPPNYEEVQSILDEVVSDSHRASQILESIHAVYRTDAKEQEPVAVNELVLRSLHSFRAEIVNNDIAAQLQLSEELSPVLGHKGQLQEVVNNLVQNAIEALAAIKDSQRILVVRTKGRLPDDAILLEVEDRGPGIDPTTSAKIFDAFTTTKSKGRGLGFGRSAWKS